MPDKKFKTNVEIDAEESKKYCQAKDLSQQMRKILNDTSIATAAGPEGLGILREKYLQLERAMLSRNHEQVVIKSVDLIRACTDISVCSQAVLKNPTTDTCVPV